MAPLVVHNKFHIFSITFFHNGIEKDTYLINEIYNYIKKNLNKDEKINSIDHLKNYYKIYTKNNRNIIKNNIENAYVISCKNILNKNISRKKISIKFHL